MGRAQNRKKEKIINIVVVIVRLLFFVWMPAVFSTAFAGVKNIVIAIAAGEPLELNSFVTMLIKVCLVTVLCGRIFCGYACAFGSLGDFVYWCQTKIRRKQKKKPLRLPVKACAYLKKGKYFVLAVVLVLCWLGYSSFITQYSPWPAFSLMTGFRFSAIPVGGGIILCLILVGMAWEPRFFCRFLCPMGAIFSLLPVMPWAVVHRRRENCIKGCRACQRTCPAGIDIVDSAHGDPGMMGECFSCGKCMRACPKGNIHVLMTNREEKG